MRPKTILIYYEQYGYGGVDTHMAYLINNWPSRDDRIVILTNRDNKGLDFLKAKLNRNNIDIKTLELGVIDSKELFFVKLFSFFWYKTFYFILQFLKTLNAIKADIFISDNGGYPGGLTCFLAVIAARLYKPRISLAFLVHHAPESRKRFIRVYADILSLIIRYLKVRLITVSNACKRILETHTPLKPFKVIYNGVEPITDGLTLLDLKKSYGISGSRVALGMIGPIDSHKGHSVFIKAFSQSALLCNKACIFIVGRGDNQLEKSLKEMVYTANLSELVIFTGFLPENSHSIIKQFDILVMPTTDFEGFGYSMAEAMLVGVPVVASRLGAIPEVIEDSKNGILVKPKDVMQLMTALESLVVDAAYRKRLGEKGKERILSCFTAKKMAQEYYDLLKAN